MKEGMKKAQQKYLAKCRRVLLVFSPSDSDIIDRLESVVNKNGYIKQLIRDDIRNDSHEGRN